MTLASTQQHGRCLCGAVGFSAAIAKNEMGACHCSMCRRWSGGVFLGVQCEAVDVNQGAPLGVYHSSEWGERCFCQVCGSTLMWRAVDGSHYAVSVQSFDNPEDYKFVSQIFIDEKPASYSFSDATHNMTGPEFIAMITSAEHQK